jgi:hypothetical protein
VIWFKQTAGCEVDIVFDTTKSNSTPRKLMDVIKLEALGWKSKTSL